jgi:hypothetical protein
MRRPLPAEGRPKFMSVAARRVDRNSFRSPCGARCSSRSSATLTIVPIRRVTRGAPFSAKRRPKFISVAARRVDRNSCRSPCGARCSLRSSATLTIVPIRRVTRGAPFSAKRRPKFISVAARRVDRNSCRSPCGARCSSRSSATLTIVPIHRVARGAPFSAKRRPKFISVTVWGAMFVAVVRYIDHCAYPPRRTRRPVFGKA